MASPQQQTQPPVRHGAILDALAAQVSVVDAQGVIREVNAAWRAFARANGAARADAALGTSYLRVCDDASGPLAAGAREVADGMRRVLARELASFEFEYPCHSNAERRWFRAIITPLDRAAGGGAVVMHIDVTAQHLAAEALRQSEERFRGMFEHAQVGIALLTPDGDFQRVNPTYAAMLGSTERELLGRHVREVTHPDDRDRHALVHARLVDGELDNYVIEKRYLDGSGRVTWGRVSVSAVRDDSRRLVSVIGIKQDITEERAAMMAVAEDNAMRDMAGRIGRIGGWSVTLPEYGVHWSEVICAIFEAPPGTQPSRDQAFGLYLPESRAVLDEAFQACARVGTPFDLELQCRTLKDSRRWVRAIGQAQRDADGTIVAIQGALQDITEQKALEQQFLRAQRLESVGILAGGIAHDLNNVLTPILMSIDLLRMDETSTERLSILEGVESSARRGAEMVRQVLTFARGAEGRRVTVQVRHVLREVEKIVGDSFPKNITLRSQVPSGIWPVNGDPTQLHQVMVNLCVNARDAMPQGGTLSIVLRERMIDEAQAAQQVGATAGPHVEIEVADTGTGMSEETLQRIFDPFFTTKELGKGTGLGLSTSIAIVKSHGGFIKVTSELGKGSAFHVFLPADAEAATGPHEPAALAIPHGLGELILVVDDEPAVRTVTLRTLARLGYRGLGAANGAEALSTYAAHRDEIALVITDMMMPVMDGSALIDMLVRLDPKVRVVAASGVQQQLDEAGRHSGNGNVREYLQKPYTSQVLLAAIRKGLEG